MFNFYSFLVGLFIVALAVVSIFPSVDLVVSSFFYDGTRGFYLSRNAVLEGLKTLAFYGSRALALASALCAIVCAIRKKSQSRHSLRGCLFLLMCLLVGPGLLANVVFKDNWGRARPREVQAFGGQAVFTPALVPSDQCARNCSFVSGDASFGFFLTSFIYVVPAGRRRSIFAGTLVIGSLFAFARLFMGAHFISDILYACLVSAGTGAGLSFLMLGAGLTQSVWREILVSGSKRH